MAIGTLLGPLLGRLMDGSIATVYGREKVVEQYTNPKLPVTLFWPFYDYWILELDQDYRFAVV